MSGGGRLLIGLVATMLVAGCGSTGEASGEPRKGSSTEGGRPLVRIHYSRPVPEDPDDGYGVEMDVIARGADQSRTKMDWLVEDGQVDETVVIVRDGNRALARDAEAETPYTLMEAADENLDDLPWESTPLDPDSDLFRQFCPDPARQGTRTILGRDAVGYACTWADQDEGSDQPEKVWLDRATGMLLEYGAMKAREFVVDPEITESTFSTTPPAEAVVHVVKARRESRRPPTGFANEH